MNILAKCRSNNENSKEILDDIDMIEAQIEVFNILNQNINDFSNEINNFEVKFEKVNLRDLIKFAFKILNPNKKENINVVLNIDDNVPQYIRTDQTRVKQDKIITCKVSLKSLNMSLRTNELDYEDIKSLSDCYNSKI